MAQDGHVGLLSPSMLASIMFQLGAESLAWFCLHEFMCLAPAALQPQHEIIGASLAKLS